MCSRCEGTKHIWYLDVGPRTLDKSARLKLLDHSACIRSMKRESLHQESPTIGELSAKLKKNMRDKIFGAESLIFGGIVGYFSSSENTTALNILLGLIRVPVTCT